MVTAILGYFPRGRFRTKVLERNRTLGNATCGATNKAEVARRLSGLAQPQLAFDSAPPRCTTVSFGQFFDSALLSQYFSCLMPTYPELEGRYIGPVDDANNGGMNVDSRERLYMPFDCLCPLIMGIHTT